MQLGLGTYAYAWAIGIKGYPPPTPMGAIAFAQRAAQLGLRVVQIADNLPLHKLSEIEIDFLQREMHALGLQVEVGTRGIAPESSTQLFRTCTAFRLANSAGRRRYCRAASLAGRNCRHPLDAHAGFRACGDYAGD